MTSRVHPELTTPGRHPDSAPRNPDDFSFWTVVPLLLIVIAFLVRIAYLFSVRHDPWLTLPVVDEIAYERLSQGMIRHFGQTLPFFRPPLWPALLAAIQSIAGDNFLFVRVINALIGAVSAWSAWRLAYRLFGRWIGLASGLLFAFDGILVHLQTTGLATALFLLLTLEALNISLDAWSRRSNGLLLLAGFFWGLAALTRPVALLPALIVLVYGLFAKYATNGHHRDSRLAPALLIAAGLAVAVIPVAAMNLVHGGSIISSNGGINLYVGNNPKADGVAPTHPTLGPGWTPEAIANWADRKTGHQLTPAQVSAFYSGKALDFWIRTPGKAVDLFARKLLLVFGGVELSNNGDLRFYASQRPLLRVLEIIGFWWIAPLAIVGVLLAWKRSREVRLVAVVALSYLLITAAFFVTARFRAPAVPLLLPFAVWTLSELLQKQTSLKRRLTIATSVLLLGSVLNLAAAKVAPGENRAYGHFLQGQLEARAGNNNAAMREFSRALQIDPRTPLANQSIGYLLVSEGEAGRAVRAFRRELALQPRASTYRGLGVAFRSLSEPDSARIAFEKGLELSPGDPELRQYYSESIGEEALNAASSKEWVKSYHLFRAAERMFSGNPFFAFGMAGSLWAEGDTARATAIIDSLSRLYPSYKPVVEWKTKGVRPFSSDE